MKDKEWKSMDTAPKNGKNILVHDKRGGIMMVYWGIPNIFSSHHAWCVVFGERNRFGND